MSTTTDSAPVPETLGAQLVASATRCGARPAYRFGRAELTYAELLQRAGGVAAGLRARGVDPGDRVVIELPKSLDMVIAVYAVLFAGAAYVPLDPHAPAGRRARVLASAAARVHVHNSATATATARTGESEFWSIAADDWQERATPVDRAAPDLDAYVLFTSGSSGEPKGIVHTHASALACARMMAAHAGLNATDRLSGIPPLFFDMSTFDLFASDTVGALTVLFSEAHLRAPASMTALLETEAISVCYATPTSLQQALDHGGLAQRDLTALRRLIYAGEPMPVVALNRLIELLRDDAVVTNAYGPTETNVSHMYDLPPGEPWPQSDVPIGPPCPGVAARIESPDDTGAGELLIAGATLMRGYLDDPERTTAATIEREGARWYRSGDRVRRNDRGAYRYLGRLDRQVKLRGVRIELAEVEAAVCSLPGVALASAYVLRGEAAQPAGLRAAVLFDDTASSTGDDDLDNLLIALRDLLPAAAVPQALEAVTSLPLTASGKVDHAAFATLRHDS
ncbi:MAG: amino acid adenylation domain-containing protein [Pseudomonadota bacterium]